MPKTVSTKKYRFPSATEASAAAETRPTMIVSTTPISISPTCTTMTGTASRTVSRSSAAVGRRDVGGAEDIAGGGGSGAA